VRVNSVDVFEGHERAIAYQCVDLKADRSDRAGIYMAPSRLDSGLRFGDVVVERQLIDGGADRVSDLFDGTAPPNPSVFRSRVRGIRNPSAGDDFQLLRLARNKYCVDATVGEV
jgi:hypothetical protein